MTEKLYKEAHVIWQTPEEDSIAETALIVESYTNVISVKQDGGDITINYSSVDELCKLLRKLKNAKS